MSVLLAVALQVAAQTKPTKIPITQNQLNRMADLCKAPRSWLKHLGGDEVRFLPATNAEYRKVDCVLKRLRASIAPMKLGFIGNEQLSEDK